MASSISYAKNMSIYKTSGELISIPVTEIDSIKFQDYFDRLFTFENDSDIAAFSRTTTSSGNGSINKYSDQKVDGNYSMRITQSTPQEYWVGYDLPMQMNQGSFSFYLYDDGPSSMDYDMVILRSDSLQYFIIRLVDHLWVSPFHAATYNFQRVQNGIDVYRQDLMNRSIGWHKIDIECESDSTKISIDGNPKTVFSWNLPISRIEFGNFDRNNSDNGIVIDSLDIRIEK